MKKAIITVLGRDSVGIIARVCTYLSDQNINILDISQTITGGFFNMMMIVDVADSKKAVEDLQTDLDDIGNEIHVSIKLQLEEIFTMMHRV